MQGVSIDSAAVEYELRLVRSRLKDHIKRGGLVDPVDLVDLAALINNALDVIEDAKKAIRAEQAPADK